MSRGADSAAVTSRALRAPARERAGRRTRALLLAGALPLASGACFATRADVRVLQQDIQTVRTERLRSDSARAAQLDRIAAQLASVTDTLRALAVRSTRFQGDARDALRGLGEQLIQVQELTGQSQRRIQELRASLEQRAEAQAQAVAGDSAAAAAAAAGPGPNQLYQIALDQYRRGSFASARTAFADLLTRFPTADVAADAQFYVAESLAGERNAAAADTAYAALVTRYPQSPRAATALYKRARARQQARRAADARAMYEELLRRFPKSDEAELAREALRELRGAAGRS